MERGGAALQSSLRTAHPSSSVACWPFVHRSYYPHRSIGGGATKPLLRRPLPEQNCACLNIKRYLLKHNAVVHCSTRAFGSSGPQETNVGSEEIRKDDFLIDCGSDQECVVGGIVALGKFDALHIGHRELAIQASKAGTPFLLSFVGIAEVLGWEPRPPIVANCDRKRVLSSWAPYCGNEVPLEYHVQFSNVRHLTPRQFVEKLSKEPKVSGVVAGANYRFGYKASGDALDLVRLCKEYGLDAFIVSPVMDNTRRSYNGASRSLNSNDRGQVSSTRVRHALSMGDMDYVAELLGRKHRLVLSLDEQFCKQNRILVPKSCMLNHPPKDGAYSNCSVLLDDKHVLPANVIICSENINIELDGGILETRDFIRDHQLIGIEFG
ncbi:hypothetical protein Cni_G13722 [Canna indica]|uniref:FAD synthase n=1 Tax=Canna indica TaxID=4628 RepID=A0AAQ3KBP7_9LILI|nr:hypothetical protein Cni_G13722 [Canna indica]